MDEEYDRWWDLVLGKGEAAGWGRWYPPPPFSWPLLSSNPSTPLPPPYCEDDEGAKGGKGE